MTDIFLVTDNLAETSRRLLDRNEMGMNDGLRIGIFWTRFF
jgi:hypothetical protein